VLGGGRRAAVLRLALPLQLAHSLVHAPVELARVRRLDDHGRNHGGRRRGLRVVLDGADNATAKALFPYSPEAHRLGPDLKLIAFLARQILIASAREVLKYTSTGADQLDPPEGTEPT
jgi:hypothetical protein